ncbi:MAG: hypothetical protein NTX82_05410 [Candidatus Parcubacteria bacterium]|nr:hypothetical protein [Candidatus Parcubacteria bacterium]
MEIPKKYQRFIDQGVKVRTDKNLSQKDEVKFTFPHPNYELVKEFLLVLDPKDFIGYEVAVYIWGKCQTPECSEEFGAEFSGEFLTKNIRRTKEFQSNGGILYVHVCPYCSFKMLGTLGFGEEECGSPRPN